MTSRRATCVLSLALALVACDAPAAPWPALEPVVRPEHPRPDFRRDSFVSLNTVWDFAYDPDDVGRSEAWFTRDDVWTDRIQVPFAWEAPLSGLADRPPRYRFGDAARATTYRGVAWYRLRIPEPPPGDDALDWHLVFGAVDFEASVYLNGQPVADHVGGYAPFDVDVSAALAEQPAAEPGRWLSIVVRVEDRTEVGGEVQPVGKQGGPWYTRTSGIWQTVYLEQRPSTYLERARLVPDPVAGVLRVIPETHGGGGALRLVARLDGRMVGELEATITGDGTEQLELSLDEVALWDVDSPTLYDLDVELEGADGARDVVHGYFGMVSVRTDWMPGRSPADTDVPTDQARAVWVNERPRILRCVLDQSYYPDGVYTAPSVERIRADLQLAKASGFNCVRVHIKMDEPVVYRLADELGLFVLYDIPSLGFTARNTGPEYEGRAHFEALLERAIERDASHPSIVAWVVFNENWGLMQSGSAFEPATLADSPDIQGWVREMVALARTLDPTRPVEDNSAGGVVMRFEHVDTDLNSFHWYTDDIPAFRTWLDEQNAQVFVGSDASFVGGGAQDGQPWLNSEIASFSVAGASGTESFCTLFGLLNEMRRQPRLVGYVVTELTDVEYELNGLVTYDREPKDLCERDGVALSDLLGDDAVLFDWLPGATVAAGTTVDVPLRVSQWSSATPIAWTVALRFAGGASVERTVDGTPFELTDAPITIGAPAAPGPATIVAELRDAGGAVRARNRLDVTVE